MIIGTISDYIWTAILNPTKVKELVIGGRASEGPPTFLKTFNFKSTWTSHIDNLGYINCAAYALAAFQSTFTSTPFTMGRPGKSKARLLQTQLGYSDFTSISELEVFVQKFPSYKILVLAYVRFNPESSFVTSFTGSLFDENNAENFTCKLVLYEKHWALTTSFDSFLRQAKKGGLSIHFCTQCVCIVKCAQSVKQEDYPCHQEERPKRLKLDKPACRAPQCNGEVHENQCPYMKCKNCQVYMGSKDHRCILLPKTFGVLIKFSCF